MRHVFEHEKKEPVGTINPAILKIDTPLIKNKLSDSTPFPGLHRTGWLSANQACNSMKVGIAMRIIVDHFLRVLERFQVRKPCC